MGNLLFRTLMATLALGTAVTAAPALAQSGALPPRPIAAADPARRALALQLAKTLAPEDATIMAIERVIAVDIPKAMLADANMKALEQEYPGVIKAVAEGMAPVLLRYSRDSLPGAWDSIADVLAESLTQDDLRAALAFYGGPTGAKIIARMHQSVDFAPVLGEMLKTEDFGLTESQLARTVRRSESDVIDRLTPQELAEAEAFVRSPTGAKIVALTPRVQAISVAEANKPNPKVDAELEAATIAAMEKFTGLNLREGHEKSK
ncbi:DUF2059 domain-containing protein [Sphingomonas sp. HF-S3]|uniref:DUF2059 domain-containing protein n=1 Tax=Sphingomonas rustica TaxID=3103142 RepID=A0ABV0BAV5_9SPHN